MLSRMYTPGGKSIFENVSVQFLFMGIDFFAFIFNRSAYIYTVNNFKKNNKHICIHIFKQQKVSF